MDIELPSPKFVDNFTFDVAWSEDQVRALLAAERARADAAERDARRWRELRAHSWFDGPDTLVVTQARNIRLGSDVPSLDRLDAAIDAATEGVQHGEAK